MKNLGAQRTDRMSAAGRCVKAKKASSRKAGRRLSFWFSVRWKGAQAQKQKAPGQNAMRAASEALFLPARLSLGVLAKTVM